MRRMWIELAINVQADADLTEEEWEELQNHLIKKIEQMNPTKDLFHIDGYVDTSISHVETAED